MVGELSVGLSEDVVCGALIQRGLLPRAKSFTEVRHVGNKIVTNNLFVDRKKRTT